MIDSIWSVSKVKLYATTSIKNLVICSLLIANENKELAFTMLGIMFIYCEQQKPGYTVCFK